MLENYQPGQVDKNVVAQDFGTTPDRLYQPFRHVVGQVERNGKKGFLKLATTSGIISRYLENEAEMLKRRGSGNYPLPVLTVPLQEQGIYDYQGRQLAWLIADHIDSEELYPFTPEHPANPERFQTHLSAIADTAIAIMDWPQTPPMPIDVPKDKVTAELINKVNGWINDRLSTPEMVSRARKAFDLQERFFINEDELVSTVDVGPSHGDFTPNQFRITPEDLLYLVDLEHTKMHWLKFYDAAYMYHRLYTKYQKPEIAKAFLKLFIETYSQAHTFDERAEQNVRIALAQRLIGGYFDAVADGVTSWELQDELSTKLLQGNSLVTLIS